MSGDQVRAQVVIMIHPSMIFIGSPALGSTIPEINMSKRAVSGPGNKPLLKTATAEPDQGVQNPVQR